MRCGSRLLALLVVLAVACAGHSRVDGGGSSGATSATQGSASAQGGGALTGQSEPEAAGGADGIAAGDRPNGGVGGGIPARGQAGGGAPAAEVGGAVATGGKAGGELGATSGGHAAGQSGAGAADWNAFECHDIANGCNADRKARICLRDPTELGCNCQPQQIPGGGFAIPPGYEYMCCCQP
jgi:hypothetical protein